DLRSLSTSPRPPHLEPISAVVRWNRDSTAVLFRPTPASGCRNWPENHGFRRRFVRMQLELPVQISPPFLHQIDRVRHQEPDRIAKETFEGRSENFGIGQNTEETLPNFRQKSKEI
ncbi:hypothetical protein Prudu_005756, partial [Prunus dulcis]